MAGDETFHEVVVDKGAPFKLSLAKLVDRYADELPRKWRNRSARAASTRGVRRNAAQRAAEADVARTNGS
eukprot:3688449-Pleurochrysis_carterae.AAC.1